MYYTEISTDEGSDSWFLLVCNWSFYHLFYLTQKWEWVGWWIMLPIIKRTYWEENYLQLPPQRWYWKHFTRYYHFWLVKNFGFYQKQNLIFMRVQKYFSLEPYHTLNWSRDVFIPTCTSPLYYHLSTFLGFY